MTAVELTEVTAELLLLLLCEIVDADAAEVVHLGVGVDVGVDVLRGGRLWEDGPNYICAPRIAVATRG
jgi:hypothetical protein